MMGGSAQVPGSGSNVSGANELGALLTVLGNPKAAEAKLAEIVARTSELNKAAEANDEARAGFERAKKELEEATATSEARLIAVQVNADKSNGEVTKKLADLRVATQHLEGELAARGMALRTQQATLDQREVDFNNEMTRRSKASEAREASAHALELAAQEELTKARVDADAAANARTLYEGKLEAIKAQLAKLAG